QQQEGKAELALAHVLARENDPGRKCATKRRARCAGCSPSRRGRRFHGTAVIARSSALGIAMWKRRPRRDAALLYYGRQWQYLNLAHASISFQQGGGKKELSLLFSPPSC